jgi:hypothetical protein
VRHVLGEVLHEVERLVDGEVLGDWQLLHEVDGLVDREVLHVQTAVVVASGVVPTEWSRV